MGKRLNIWILRVIMIILAAVSLYPVIWNIVNSFKTNTEYLTDPYSLPSHLELKNYALAWEKANIATYFGNSVLVTVLSVLILL
ncbi:MAG: carbohydrate ABC transporter permease, partial [Lachnospiraceae bacterium]|nr:carbohydrate ABC transporter permease [Lachnospiraceae bacterium]